MAIPTVAVALSLWCNPTFRSFRFLRRMKKAKAATKCGNPSSVLLYQQNEIHPEAIAEIGHEDGVFAFL